MVWTLLVEVLVFVVTVVMAMVDTQQSPSLFFYVTIASVVILNMANGIYQNTVFGIAAKLPFKYTGAVVLGSVSLLTPAMQGKIIHCETNLQTNAITRAHHVHSGRTTQYIRHPSTFK